MRVSLIVSKTENNVIGKDNRLIWHLPNDLKRFKSITTGYPVIMGRKTYLSLPARFRPLPGRTNIVLTRNKDFKALGCVIKHSLKEALDYCEENDSGECFIIGGGEVYQQALEKDLIERMYVTELHTKLEGDTFFPVIDFKCWKRISETFHRSDAVHPFDYSFVIYERVASS